MTPQGWKDNLDWERSVAQERADAQRAQIEEAHQAHAAANFVTMDVDGVERARALVAALAERGVFIRMPGAPPLDRCVRVTVGTPEERAAFAAILRAVWPQVAEALPTTA
jgi:histidinol-phosphate aminotransferase